MYGRARQRQGNQCSPPPTSARSLVPRLGLRAGLCVKRYVKRYVTLDVTSQFDGLRLFATEGRRLVVELRASEADHGRDQVPDVEERLHELAGAPTEHADALVGDLLDLQLGKLDARRLRRDESGDEQHR